MLSTKKVTDKELGKLQPSEVEDGCKLISSLKLRNIRKLSSLKGRKRTLSSNNKVKAINSALSKKVVEKYSSVQSNKGRSKNSKRSTEALSMMHTKNPSTVANPIEDVQVKKQRRKRKKRRRENLVIDEASRLERRMRYLLIKMKLEQNLIDAYSGEGWKGHSREKIKPVKELQRAKKKILNCKLGIRDAIHELDNLSSAGRIEDSAIAPDGSVYHEHIFCAVCKQGEAYPDNDIILCDGTCNRAFHQKCLDPPLDSESIPPEDQCWFCRFCECKIEILESMNAHLGTSFSIESNWEEIFKEEAALADAGIEVLDPEDEWPSDDSADHDYDPEKRADYPNLDGVGTDDNVSLEASSSTSLSWSLDGEDFSGCQKLEHEATSNNPYSSDDFTDGDVLYGPRQRSAVDYKQLYHEMFGKDAAVVEQVSEDEDWGPTKKRRREKESDAATTLMTLHESEKNCSSIEPVEGNKKISEESQSKRTIFRLPLDAVEKLRQAFAENELPSRSVREKLSEELGLDHDKVSKWFKNARYLALRSRKAEKEDRNSDSAKVNNEPVEEMAIEQSTNDVVALKEVLATFQSSENAKVGQKTSKSPSKKPIKMELKRCSLASPANTTKSNNVEIEDNICLKKQINLLKTKSKKKQVGLGSIERLQIPIISIDDRSQRLETEMERLCRLKSRLEDMRRTLLRFPSRKKSKVVVKESSVVYVPTAVVKEKNIV